MKNILKFLLISLAVFSVETASADYMLVPIKKVIDGGLAEFVRRSITEAERDNFEGIIFHVDTPGGRVDSAVDIKDTILNADLTTIAFVDKNAISAGSLISLACDSLFMSTGASIGAATAVDMQGKKASEKVISYFRAQMRATAEATGRRTDIAEAMVDEEIEIEGVSKKGKLVTLTYTEALELGISNGTTETVEELLESIGKKGSEIMSMKPNWAENLVRFFTHPVVSSLLMSIGFLGLMIEIRTPGWGIGGTLGIIALGLFFGSHYIVNLAGVGELIIFAAGIIMLTLEVLVIPGFGFAGVAGIALIIASLYLSLVGRLPQMSDYSTATGTIAAAFALTILGTALLVRFIPRTAIFDKIVLSTEERSDRGFASAESDSSLIGNIGITQSDLRPAGKIQIDGKRIDVVSEGDFIASGEKVKVIEVRGSRIVVKKV